MRIEDRLERIFPNTVEGRKVADEYIRKCKVMGIYSGHNLDIESITVRTVTYLQVGEEITNE